MQFLGTTVHAQPAQQAQPRADDPALEARVVDIADGLRCLVCQNETVAASNADLAVDLRSQIRQQLRDGRSDAEIRAYMVERYGDFVLYRPPLKATTVLLWVGPFLLLLMAAWLMRRHLRDRAAAPPPLTESQRKKARALLQDGPR
ncbi:MAG TPA: cytochrome c-type biogenesis protein [Rubrivivax sp.]|nr:cytochrome c-type biogenesis protein [Rubrivivax sp.]